MKTFTMQPEVIRDLQLGTLSTECWVAEQDIGGRKEHCKATAQDRPLVAADNDIEIAYLWRMFGDLQVARDYDVVVIVEKTL